MAILLSVALLPSPLCAAFEETGGGARAPGMGNVFAAIADDVYSLYYNPAGLGTLERAQLGASYSRLFMGLSDSSDLGQSHIALARPLKEGRAGALGWAWQSFKLDDLYTERSLGLSYGRLAARREGLGSLYWGVSLKNLQRSFRALPEAFNALDRLSATGQPDPLLTGSTNRSAWDLDAGLLLRSTRRASLGLAFSHINRPDMAFSSGDRLPLRTRLGMGYKSLWMNFGVELRMEKSPTGGQDRDFAIAAERYFPTLDRGQFGLRTSLGIGSRQFRQVTAGLSYRINKIQADYAFLLPLGTVRGTAGTHRLGITIQFGASTPEEAMSAELLSQMQRLRQRQAGGPAYETDEVSGTAGLDRPELAPVRTRIEAGEYQQAHEKLVSLMDELPPDAGLLHLARRLDFAASHFPELIRPTQRWQKAAARGTQAFLWGKDKKAVLLVAYAQSLDPDQVRLEKYLGMMASMTRHSAPRPAPDLNLWQDRHNRAAQAFEAKDFLAALQYCREALELEPEDLIALSRLGTNLYRLGRYGEAIDAWEKALRSEKNPEERASLQSYLAKARKASVEPVPEPVPEKVTEPPPPADPREIERLYQKGIENYLRGELDAAAAAFGRILRLDPDNVQAQRALERIRRKPK